MKKSVSSFDLMALAEELQPLAGQARFDKAFQPAKDEVVVRLRAPGEGVREWRCKAGRWAYLSQGTKDWPESLTPFATQLRTHLDGARLAGVRQVAFDRILELEFAKAGASYTLACELFADGNVVLAKEGRVMQALRVLKVAHRTVAPGQLYVHPPARLDPKLASDEELHTRFMGSKADAVRTLATEWNLGGQYAEEVCARAGVDKRLKAAQAPADAREALVAALRALVAQARERPEPVLVRDGAALVDCTPVPLVTLQEHSFEARGAVGQALEDYFTAYAKEHERPEDPRVAALEEERARLERQIAIQRESLAGFEASAEEQRTLGDLLYARYAEVDALASQARERLAAGGWAALEAWAREPAQPAPFRVLDADGAEGVVRVELEGRKFALPVEGGVEASAQRCYEAAKRHREKAEGAAPALKESEAQLARLDAEGAQLSEKLAKERARRRFEPTKRLWYETYRWFVSSEGHLVLGGRDAQSNDKLVKKHLEANDRYVHADQAGAPSVVIKRGDKPEVGAQTLKEAAEFAVAFSKAWQRRIGSADAYWVTPEQVSKTPQAGEYLGKGAFVIRGKRNFVSCPLRAAVGEVEVEGHRKVMGGPVDAVAARATRYVVLEPGTDDTNTLAKRLGEEFMVPVEEVQAVLPPGPVRVVEDLAS